jgi:hypothetical protein
MCKLVQKLFGIFNFLFIALKIISPIPALIWKLKPLAVIPCPLFVLHFGELNSRLRLHSIAFHYALKGKSSNDDFS